jgi:hypothetical protein
MYDEIVIGVLAVFALLAVVKRSGDDDECHALVDTRGSNARAADDRLYCSRRRWNADNAGWAQARAEAERRQASGELSDAQRRAVQRGELTATPPPNELAYVEWPCRDIDAAYNCACKRHPQQPPPCIGYTRSADFMQVPVCISEHGFGRLVVVDLKVTRDGDGDDAEILTFDLK